MSEQVLNDVGDDVGALQPPMRHQALQDRHLTRDGGIDGLGGRSLGGAVAQQVEGVHGPPARQQRGDAPPHLG